MASVPEMPLTAGAADRRVMPRADLWLGVRLHGAGEERVIAASILNLSATGFLAELADGNAMPAELDIELPNAGRRRAEVVWSSGQLAGCTFASPLARADLSAAQLRSEFRALEEERGLPLLGPAPALPAAGSPRDAADPIWEMAAEALPDEKWPLRQRLLLIAGAAVLPWALMGGAALLLL